MNYFVTIVYNVTSGNAINLLGTAFIFGLKTSFEMTEERLNVSLFLWKTYN